RGPTGGTRGVVPAGPCARATRVARVRWAIRLSAPAAADADVWNRRLLDLGCDLAGAVGVEELAVHLRDEPARAAPKPEGTAPAGFDALFEIAGDERARAAVDALCDLGPPRSHRVAVRRPQA